MQLHLVASRNHTPKGLSDENWPTHPQLTGSPEAQPHDLGVLHGVSGLGTYYNLVAADETRSDNCTATHYPLDDRTRCPQTHL